jgi:hypothetical protein
MKNIRLASFRGSVIPLAMASSTAGRHAALPFFLKASCTVAG